MSWIPAHTPLSAIEILISAEDRAANNAADALAKDVARAGAPSPGDMKRLQELDDLVDLVARWIGYAAVITSQPGQRDTAASQKAKRQWRAAAIQARASMPPLPPSTPRLRARSFGLGGHILGTYAHGWRWRCEFRLEAYRHAKVPEGCGSSMRVCSRARSWPSR